MDQKEINRFLGEVGLDLWRIRDAAGLSRQQLKKKSKVGTNTILRYENGTASPTLRIVAVIADALGYETRIQFVKKEEPIDDSSH
jgi:transcriptional regulator with XRE-family HTH domain